MKAELDDGKGESFRSLVRGLFSYSKSPNLAPNDLLQNIVYRIDPSYQVVGLVGIGLEGAVLKVLDISNTEFALKIASTGFSEGGKKKKKIYSLFRFKSENENTFQKRFIEGCKVQRDVANLIHSENADFIEVPGGVEVSSSPGIYVKMAYLHGPPVLNYIKDLNNFHLSMRIYAQLLKSVEFFHTYGFIHRDIKSPNIIITGTHKAKLKVGILDWTMAKQCGVEGITIAGVSIGTPGYSSPKLSIDGDAKSANYSDDVFALGMMLYEFCTCKYLPRVKDPRTLLTDANVQEEYVNHVGKSIPTFLIPIFRRATDKDETKRYQTVTPFLYEFTQALKSEGINFDNVGWEAKDTIEERLVKIEKKLEALGGSINDFYNRFAKIANTGNEKGNSDCLQTKRIKKLEKPDNTDTKTDTEIANALDIVFPEG